MLKLLLNLTYQYWEYSIEVLVFTIFIEKTCLYFGFFSRLQVGILVALSLLPYRIGMLAGLD
jgi:hypothetical protein